MLIFVMADERARAELLPRVVARMIDFLVVMAAVEALPRAGAMTGLVYILIGDGLFGGQSLGKKLLSIRVVGADGRECGLKESIFRNSTLATGFALSWIPFVGWLLLTLIVGFESVILIGSRDGRRLGDEMAGTSVLDVREKTALKKES